MTLTLKDLDHLETMDWLEKKATYKQASIARKKASMPAEEDPTSLMEKLLTLSSKLRGKGFDKAAEELEESILHFRQPEAEESDPLYHTNDETGEDLLMQAHPDGDVVVAPAKDHQGDVETPISEHRKILEVVIHPTKKTMLLAMLRKSLGVKEAQSISNDIDSKKKEVAVGEFTDIVNEIKDKVSRYMNGIKDTKYDITFSDKTTTVGHKEVIQNSLDHLAGAITVYKFNATVPASMQDKEQKNKATSWPQRILEECIRLCNSIQATRLSKEPQDIARVNAAFDNPAWSVQLKAECVSLQHRWYKFWAEYETGSSADKDYHGSFITSGQIETIIKGYYSRFEALKMVINDTLLSSNVVKASPDVSSFLAGISKFVGDTLATLSATTVKLNTSLNASVDSLGSFKELTMKDVEAAVDPKMSGRFKYSSVGAFSTSINELYKQIAGDVAHLVDANPIFTPSKSELLPHLNNLVSSANEVINAS